MTFIYNLAGISLKDGELKKVIRRVGLAVSVNQEWSMFAPYPIKNDGWFVVDGTFKSGEKRDVLTGQPVTYEKPVNPSDAYPSTEWRKLMLNIWDRADRKILLPYARFLCRKFSKANGYFDDLATFKIEFVKETTPSPGEPFPPVQTRSLWSHDCFLKTKYT